MDMHLQDTPQIITNSLGKEGVARYQIHYASAALFLCLYIYTGCLKKKGYLFLN